MKDPDQLYKDLIIRYSLQSKCRSRQVGAILVDKFGHVFGQGFNGAPRGSSCDFCPRCLNKTKSGENLEQAICAHAEANLIANAARSGRSTDGATIYVTVTPCAECSKLIVGAGIIEVIYINEYPSALSNIILSKANIKVRKFHE